MTDDTTHHVNESADKIQLTTKLKRGSGTRDQDSIKIKIKGDDPDAAVAKLNRTLENLEATADDLRAVQPGGEEA